MAAEMVRVVGEEIDLALDRVLREQSDHKPVSVIYPLHFNDGFRPAVLEVAGSRHTVRSATPAELADIF